MKLILLIILTIIQSNQIVLASAKSANDVFLKEKGRDKNKLIAHELIDGEFYFSAIPFINNFLEENNQIDAELENDIETLVIKTGSIAILNLEDKRLEKFTSPSISLILGTRLFNKEQYKKAFEVLNNIPEDHKFAIESALIKGTIKNLERKNIEALTFYETCIKKAKKNEDDLKNEKLKKYYNYLLETCLIRTARLKMEEKKYSDAVEIYDQLDKRSYKWPYVLLDKAWAHYYLGDYNRSLGIAVTFKSPLMESYFFPEAEVLTALSYYNLCLWDDSLSVVEHFYDFYQSKALELKDLLGKNKKSETYFLDLYYADTKTREDLNPFIRNLITQTRKQVKFNLDLASLLTAKEELQQLKRLKNKNTFTISLEKNLDSTIEFISKKINFYIKKEIFTFLNEIHKHSYSMFNLKLELLSKKREDLYKSTNANEERSRGAAENVKRKKNQYFFDFNGSFWADELGDYSFGLTSKCNNE